jgi:hypothetical protein
MMTLVWELELPDSEKLVLLALADCANDEGHCWPGITALKKKCSKSDRTVQIAIKMLCTKGHLTRREVLGRGCNYTVHPIVRFAPTPEATAPRSDCAPKRTPPTPEAASGKPLRTIIASEAKASSASRAKFPAPLDVPDGVWTDFLTSPKRRKAGMSATAYSGIANNLKILAEHGFPPGEMIALAVERGWTTVKLEWVLNDNDRQQRTNGMARNQSDGLSA